MPQPQKTESLCALMHARKKRYIIATLMHLFVVKVWLLVQIFSYVNCTTMDQKLYNRYQINVLEIFEYTKVSKEALHEKLSSSIGVRICNLDLGSRKAVALPEVLYAS